MKNSRRIVAAAVVTGSLLVGGAAAAYAVGQGRTYHRSLSASGVSFTGTTYTFLASSNQHGGMEWMGTLTDTDHGDGHSVKVWARVEGYGYGDAHTVQNGSLWVHRVMYDGQALYTSQGRVQAHQPRRPARRVRGDALDVPLSRS